MEHEQGGEEAEVRGEGREGGKSVQVQGEEGSECGDGGWECAQVRALVQG